MTSQSGNLQNNETPALEDSGQDLTHKKYTYPAKWFAYPGWKAIYYRQGWAKLAPALKKNKLAKECSLCTNILKTHSKVLDDILAQRIRGYLIWWMKSRLEFKRITVLIILLCAIHLNHLNGLNGPDVLLDVKKEFIKLIAM